MLQSTLSAVVVVIMIVWAQANSVAQTVPTYVPQDGLIGWWPFNGNLNDSSQEHLHGVSAGSQLVGYTTDFNQNKSGALSLNGSNWVRIDDSPTLRLKTGSISCWFNTDVVEGAALVYKTNTGPTTEYATSENYALVWYKAPGNYPYNGRLVGAVKYQSRCRPGNGWIRPATDQNSYEFIDGKWHHATLAWDSSLVTLWLDGVAVDTVSVPGVWADDCAGSPLLFGQGWYTDAPGYVGAMDDLLIWNRKLSDDEIRSIYERKCNITVTAPPRDTAVKQGQPFSLTIRAELSTLLGGNGTGADTVIYVGLLTSEQRDSLIGQQFASASYFNPVQDAEGRWFISREEINSTINARFQWVKDLPLILYEPNRGFTYQWQKFDLDGFATIADSDTYSGSQSRTLRISSADYSSVGNYRCIVSSSGCSVETQSAIVTLAQSPTDTNFITGVDFPYTKVAGTERYVSPAGSNSTGTGTIANPYQTIQYAIDQASNGQIVTLLRGTYRGAGNYDISTRGKQLTVQSHEGPLVTVIDCEKNGRAFYINQGETMTTMVKGITMINGKNGVTAPFGGSAIFVEDNSGLKIVDCFFRYNLNGCIALGKNEVSGPQSAIENCAFIGNKDLCIVATKKSFYSESCLYMSNASPDGGIVSNGHVADPPQYHQNNMFFENNGQYLVALCHGKIMRNSIFSGNKVSRGLVWMATNWSGTNTVDHCSFYNNISSYYDVVWNDHLGAVKSSIFFPGNARDHISGKQSSISYSSSLGNGISGSGNIQGNPLFNNPNALDFSLKVGSPCIGTGEAGTNMGADVTKLPKWMFDVVRYYDCSTTLVSHPSSATVTDGQQVSLSVSATSGSPISYQWQRKDGANWVDIANDPRFFGATSSKLTVESAQTSKAGPYRCIVSSGGCSVTSNEATLTINCNCN